MGAADRVGESDLRQGRHVAVAVDGGLTTITADAGRDPCAVASRRRLNCEDGGSRVATFRGEPRERREPGEQRERRELREPGTVRTFRTRERENPQNPEHLANRRTLELTEAR